MVKSFQILRYDQQPIASLRRVDVCRNPVRHVTMAFPDRTLGLLVKWHLDALPGNQVLLLCVP